MKKKQDKLARHLPWFAAALVSVMILGALIWYMWPEEEKGTELEVDEVYFSTKEVGGIDTDLEILVFITNEGKKDVKKVEVRAFAVETDSNLARDEARADLIDLKGETSVEGKLYITVPNNDTYRIELLIFEEGKLSIRGSGTVDLTGVGTATDYRTEESPSGSPGNNYDGIGIDSEGGSASSAMIICFLMLVIGIGLLVFMVVMATRKKDRPTPPADTGMYRSQRRLWDYEASNEPERSAPGLTELDLEKPSGQKESENAKEKE